MLCFADHHRGPFKDGENLGTLFVNRFDQVRLIKKRFEPSLINPAMITFNAHGKLQHFLQENNSCHILGTFNLQMKILNLFLSRVRDFASSTLAAEIIFSIALSRSRYSTCCAAYCEAT